MPDNEECSATMGFPNLVLSRTISMKLFNLLQRAAMPWLQQSIGHIITSSFASVTASVCISNSRNSSFNNSIKWLNGGMTLEMILQYDGGEMYLQSWCTFSIAFLQHVSFKFLKSSFPCHLCHKRPLHIFWFVSISLQISLSWVLIPHWNPPSVPCISLHFIALQLLQVLALPFTSLHVLFDFLPQKTDTHKTVL